MRHGSMIEQQRRRRQAFAPALFERIGRAARRTPERGEACTHAAGVHARSAYRLPTPAPTVGAAQFLR